MYVKIKNDGGYIFDIRRTMPSAALRKGVFIMSQYAVVDLEMCKVPNESKKGKYPYSHETIQIGAVLLDDSYEIKEKFVTYVSPQYGYIDNFISNLTGIHRNDVKDAPLMREALQRFVDWLPKEVKLVSWSENDEMQIRHEIEAKNIHIDGFDAILDNWIDCQKIFSEKMKNSKCYNLAEALIAANIIYEDGAHDGLVDAYNTALLFAKMQTEPELKLNPYYQNAISGEESSSGFTIGNLFAGLDLKGLVSTT